MVKMVDVIRFAENVSTRIKLHDGTTMPIFGLGMYQSQGGVGGQAEMAVLAALNSGYRLIDTAAYHG